MIDAMVRKLQELCGARSEMNMKFYHLREILRAGKEEQPKDK